MTPKYSNTTTLQLLLVFILSIGVIWFQSLDYEKELRTGDSYIYLSTAIDLKEKGVLTNGTFGGSFPEKGAQGQGTFFTPIYPLFLSVIMRFDKTFYENSKCHVASTNGAEASKCGNDYKNVIKTQIILGAINAVFIWIAAFLLTRKTVIAWGSVGIALLSGVYGEYATHIMTEAILFPLFTLACFLGALAWQYRKNLKKSAWFWLACGIAFGLVTLTRPAYAYVLYIGAPFLFLSYLLFVKNGFANALKIPLILFMGFIIIVGPWIMRNGITTGDYVISKGYGPYILVQRLAYNDMTMQEWRASFLYHMPDFGDKLAKKLYGEDAYARFKYENKEGFFYIGHTKFRQQINSEVDNPDEVMGHLIKNYLIPNLGKHTIVTFSMLANGIGIGKYWAFVIGPLFLLALILALVRNWGALIVCAFPGIFMLGFHAFTSVNVTRYNMPMVPAMSLAAAWVLYIGYQEFKTRKNKV